MSTKTLAEQVAEKLARFAPAEPVAGLDAPAVEPVEAVELDAAPVAPVVDLRPATADLAADAGDVAGELDSEAVERVDVMVGRYAAVAYKAAEVKVAGAQRAGADVYGVKLAAYLGRLADPVKRAYAVACADALVAGRPFPRFVQFADDCADKTPRLLDAGTFGACWAENAAEGPADVQRKVAKNGAGL